MKFVSSAIKMGDVAAFIAHMPGWKFAFVKRGTRGGGACDRMF
jgi:hypothetical protein